jgi:hypothetical protein
MVDSGGQSVAKPEILVLVDQKVESGAFQGMPARGTGWRHVLSGWSFTEKSIADSTEPTRIYEYKAVILNWSAANGDSNTGSDTTLNYFQNEAENRKARLLHRKGRLICEYQDAAGILHQGAYDAVFGKGEVQVAKRDLDDDTKLWVGPEVEVWQRYRQHPIVRNLPRTMATHYEDSDRIFNFIQGPLDGAFSYDHREQILWYGWFKWWRKGWIPLLRAKLPKGHPYRRCWLKSDPAVLLVKCQDNGIYVASTMWLALSRSKELVENILKADVDEISKTHRRLKWEKRAEVWILWPIALSVLCLGLWKAAACLGITGQTFAGILNRIGRRVEDFGEIWIAILLLVFYANSIGRRAHGIGLLHCLKVAVCSLPEFFGWSRDLPA